MLRISHVSWASRRWPKLEILPILMGQLMLAQSGNSSHILNDHVLWEDLKLLKDVK
jgi:hypothetical protein